MKGIELNQESLNRIQELIAANFTGRDELYAAANSLDSEAQQQVCHRLAEHLAGHAAELQQIVAASGVDPAGPLDLHALARSLFEIAKLNRGESGVLQAATEGEHNLKQDYEAAIDETDHPQTENVLRRQRDEVEFNEQVLRGMTEASKSQEPKK